MSGSTTTPTAPSGSTPSAPAGAAPGGSSAAFPAVPSGSQPTSPGGGLLSGAGNFLGGIWDKIKSVFVDKNTGQANMGGIISTVAIGGLGAYLGSGSGMFGTLLGGLAGAAGSVLLEPVIKPLMDQLLSLIGLKPAGVPQLSPEAQPDSDVSRRRPITIAQPGQQPPIETHINVPNMERFRRVSDETHGLVNQLTQQRREVERMEPGAARDGAVRILMEREGNASKLLANTQAWDQMSAEWSRPGGEGERLTSAYRRARESLGQPFDPASVPTPPTINPRLPELPDDMKRHAINTFVGSGGGSEAAFMERYPRPQDRLTYAWTVYDNEMKANEPDWNKTGAQFFGVGPRMSGGAAIGRNQGDDAKECKKALEECRWDDAINLARAGQGRANEGRWGFSGDTEAAEQFRRAERYAQAAKNRGRVDELRTQAYGEIKRIEDESAAKFPKFINDVTHMEADIKTMNLEIQRGIKVEARAQVPGRADHHYVTFRDKATNTDMTLVAKKVGDKWEAVSTFRGPFDANQAFNTPANQLPPGTQLADIFTDQGIVANTDYAKSVTDTLVPVRARLNVPAPAATGASTAPAPTAPAAGMILPTPTTPAVRVAMPPAPGVGPR